MMSNRLGGHAAVRAEVPWVAALVAGLVGGAGMGVLLHYQLFILPMFGLLVGWPTVLGGIAVHAVASVAFALPFAVLVARPPVRDRATTGTVVGLGLGYGVVLWGLAFGVALPLLTRVRPVGTLSLPYLPVDALVAHLAYGLVLGLTVALVGGSPATDRR